MFEKLNTKIMGVINITPDSFSDGGKWLEESTWQENLPVWAELGVNVYDIGAQSTAPGSQTIDSEMEWSRFQEHLLPHLSLFPQHATLSIDTIRPEIFKKIYDKTYEQRPDIKLLFNDISGQLDDSWFKALKETPGSEYIYSHNLAPDRLSSARHMEYIDHHHLFIEELISYFQIAEERLIAKGLGNQVLFDPCFGFSKNFEQNIELLKNIEQLFCAFPRASFVLGISKKSFLQQLQPPFLNKSQKRESSEFLHACILGQVVLKWERHLRLMPFYNTSGQKDAPFLYLRVHNPLVAINAINFVTDFSWRKK